MFENHKFTNRHSGHDRYAVSLAAKKPKAAMIIMHGFGEHGGRYENMMEFLASKNISSFVIDQEGHGQSGDKQGVCRSYDIMHADVSQSLEKAREIFPGVPVFIHGHSMGGGLVLNHGLKHSPDVVGYTVSAPLIIPAEPIKKPLRAVVKLLRKLAPNMRLGNDISGAKVSSIKEEQELYEADPLNHGRLGVGLAVDIVEGGEWVLANRDKWNAPLLLMHARGDQLTSFAASEAFAAEAQNCHFIPMENCEHEIHNDVTRDEVYNHMVQFIEQNL